MPIRFQHGGAYSSDINNLRNQIRANGTAANLQAVRLTHPNVPNWVDLHINLAFEPNSNFPPINGSLYTVAMTNPQGTWHFAVGAIGVPLPGVPFPGAPNGSYASLGHPLPPLPDITDVDLMNSLISVNTYAGLAPIPAGVENGLARLIVAVSESVRFDAVTSGVNGVLGNAASYTPPWAVLHGWGGHSIGG